MPYLLTIITNEVEEIEAVGVFELSSVRHDDAVLIEIDVGLESRPVPVLGLGVPVKACVSQSPVPDKSLGVPQPDPRAAIRDLTGLKCPQIIRAFNGGQVCVGLFTVQLRFRERFRLRHEVVDVHRLLIGW